MTKIENEIHRINKFIEWEQNSCHFIYSVAECSDISNQDLKTAFNYVIRENYHNAEFHSIDDISGKFKEIKYEEQSNYFNQKNIHVIDCSNLDKEKFQTFKSLYEIGKPNKLIFIYYVPREKLIEYVRISDQYHLRTGTIDNINDELVKIHQYFSLKDKINSENDGQTTSTKKPKI